MHSERRRGKARTRVLYWFRTPPGVRVGRAALDEDAIRLIEELNPFIEFDWTRILKGQGGPPTEPRVPEEAKRSRPPGREPRQERSGPRQQQPSRATAETAPPPDLAPASGSAPFDEPSEVSTSAVDAQVGEFDDFRDALRSEAPVVGSDDDAVAVDSGTSPVELEPQSFEDQGLSAPTAAGARLGAEALQRLRARHAEILARISEKVPEPVRRDELKSLADRLNPDMWVTDDEVTRGLEQYESVFASLREVVGRKRRRRRRGNRSAKPSATSDARVSAETVESENDVRTGGGADGESDLEPDQDDGPETGQVRAPDEKDEKVDEDDGEDPRSGQD